MSPSTTRGRVLTLLGLVTATAVFIAVIPGHRGWFDVGVYYGTVHHWVHGGALYDYQRPGTPYGFTYPPFAALCMLPMMLLDWHPAIAVSVVLGVVASAALLYWLVDPIARREGWNRWYAFGIAACMFAVLNPVRDTFSFGQINVLLLALAFADWRLLAHPRYRRYAGIGIGLAAAIKLTPVIFIGYLLITRQLRAATVAVATAVGVTLLSALAAPQASHYYWTHAIWDTSRIGALDYISNQSLQGMVARLDPGQIGHLVWIGLALAVLAFWAYHSRRAVQLGDQLTGFALTGLVSCLLSPITWVHHMVWITPALLLVADAGLRSHDRSRRRVLLTGAWTAFVILVSGLVWLWRWHATGTAAFLGANAYLWIALGLLVTLPATLSDRDSDLAELLVQQRRPAEEPALAESRSAG